MAPKISLKPNDSRKMGANGAIEKSTVECLKSGAFGSWRSLKSSLLRLHSPDHRYWHELRAEAPTSTSYSALYDSDPPSIHTFSWFTSLSVEYTRRA
ncbi:unnamed protein product [Linum trigynum]|uniref:Uncharacterized protein n=1 Tax=Linum trigynum TaxID=586398 RepID=A0AAV2FTE2_9ROSI